MTVHLAHFAQFNNTSKVISLLMHTTCVTLVIHFGLIFCEIQYMMSVITEWCTDNRSQELVNA